MRRIRALVYRIHPRALVLCAAALAGLALIAAAVVPLLLDEPAAGRFALDEGADAVGADGLRDADGDGLSDASENYRHGTDPAAWNSAGSPIPDGWLVSHGYDPLDPAVHLARAAMPPEHAIPPSYRGIYPDAYAATLWDVYSLGRPDSWDEPTDGPWDSGLDPRHWDNNNDGVADGFMLHFGLDPLDSALASTRLAGEGGLTVAQAFGNGTDPRKLDTDGDGLADLVELQGPASADGTTFPPTDPTRFSTAGSGACDGYLVHHGVDPHSTTDGLQDLDLDGATTLEEFQWSHATFGQEACKSGKGADPRLQHTLETTPIPDGWLIRYGFDVTLEGVAEQVTQSSDMDPGPPSSGEMPIVTLTVLDEYLANRPAGWAEAVQGPWWGGTDPAAVDTDGDGLGDAWELRGYVLTVATKVGGAAGEQVATSSDPRKADTDGDGLGDLAEADPGPAAEQGFGPTDARRRDTDFDGVPDAVEVANAFGLDPTRADSAGDLLRDGDRLAMLQQRGEQYALDLGYEYEGETPRTLRSWIFTFGGREALDPQTASVPFLLDLLAPLGDLDDDGMANILDSDMDEDGLLNGWEKDPPLYASSPFGLGELRDGRSATDPLNPDTDGDGLRDGWEVQHGRMDATIQPRPAYNLDPLRWDSNGNGVADGAEDPDGDSIEWVAYDEGPGGLVPRVNTFRFTNAREQQYETRPNDFASNADGIADGWKVFWGVIYPSLSRDNPEHDIGDRYPGAPAKLVQVDPAIPVAVPGVKVSEQDPPALAILPTQRFIDLGGSTSVPASQLLEHEQQTDPHLFEVPGLDSFDNRFIAELVADLVFSFAQSQASLSNPFMDDTDGDGMEDAWEWFHRTSHPGSGCPADGGLLVTIPDGEADLDGDGLGNLMEFLEETDPLCTDTDKGSLDDPSELEHSLEPDNPSDDLVDSSTDTDGDGVTDVQERVTLRTDPRNPDTDGDGLLDGAHIPSDGTFLSPSDPRVQRFMDLGIAFGMSGSGYHFYGEQSLSSSPLDPYPAVTNIPQGWLFSRGINVNEGPFPSQAKRMEEAYSLGMPAWWHTPTHGPWWGGLTPDEMSRPYPWAALAAADLDGDGLDDAIGEDPLPAYNHYNRPRQVDFHQHGVAAPPQGTSPAEPGLGPLTARLHAQSFQDPRVLTARGILRDVDPARLHGEDDHVARTVPTLELWLVPTQLTKGGEVTVEGRVHAAGADLEGLPVEARIGGQVFGVGFAQSNGDFRLPLNLSSHHQSAIPPRTVVYNGAMTGQVEWTADTGAVLLGDNVVTVRTYATPNTPPFSQDFPAVASVEKAFVANVLSPATVSLDAPADATTGEPLLATVQLLDGAQRPLEEPVRITWLGTTFDVSPQAADEGRVQFSLEAPHAMAGSHALQASFVPSDPNLGPASTSIPIHLRNPITRFVLEAPEEWEAGRPLRVRGEVGSLASAVKDAQVTVTLSSADGAAVAEDTWRTDGRGLFEGALPLGRDLAHGSYVLLGQVAQTSTTVMERASETVGLRSIPRIVFQDDSHVRLGEPLTLKGRLIEPSGQGIPQAPLTYTAGASSGSASTGPNGGFEVALSPPQSVGSFAQTVRFGGDALHLPVQGQKERYVAGGTTIEMASGIKPRGQDLQIPVRLSDDAGNPIQGANLALQWGEEDPRMLPTDTTGTAWLTRPGSPDEPLGVYRVEAVYGGAVDGTLGPSRTAAVWQVSAVAVFDLPEGDVLAGTPIPSARLFDAGSDTPLAGSLVTVEEQIDGNRTSRTVRTSDEGGFRFFDPPLRNADPFVAVVTATFAGNEDYRTVSQTSTLRFKSPTEIGGTLLGSLVAGRESLLLANVTDARGQPVEGGQVTAWLGEASIGLSEVHDGKARVSIRVPHGQASGPMTLGLEYSGSSTHGASRSTLPAEVQRAAELELSLDRARAGKAATVRITLQSSGEPMAFAPVHLSVEGMEGGLLATTNEDGVAVFHVTQTNKDLRLAARYGGDQETTAAASSTVLTPITPQEIIREGSRVVGWVLAAAATAAAAAAYWIYRLRRHPMDAPLRRARKAIQARGPVEQHILLAYQILEDAAIEQGLLADVAPTPRTLQEAVAPALPPSVATPLEVLVSLFETARYGNTALDEMHKDRALDSLEQIRSHLPLLGPASGPSTEAAHA